MGISFTTISLISALTTPYQKTYMNIFDALLFFNMALLCFLFGSDTSVPIIARLLLAAPIVFIVALVLLRNMHRHIIHCWDCFKVYTFLLDVAHVQHETTAIRSTHDHK